MSLTLDDGKLLIKAAKASVKAHLLGKIPEPDAKLKERFPDKQGLFVTIKQDNQLRGCIGFPEPVYPLCEGILKAAISAAFEDPRFPPVTDADIPSLKFEVSVLTIPEEIVIERPDEYLEKIVIGRDGLILRSPIGSGLLLPQVAVEYNWNVEEFLKNLCTKARMPREAWRNPQNKIFRFTAQIFEEVGTEIVEKKE